MEDVGRIRGIWKKVLVWRPKLTGTISLFYIIGNIIEIQLKSEIKTIFIAWFYVYYTSCVLGVVECCNSTPHTVSLQQI